MKIGENVAKAGIRKFVMVTSHGGNSAAMSLVAQELRARRQILAVTTAWGRLSAPERLFAAEESSTAFMAARSRPRSCWRAMAKKCGVTRSPIFVPRPSQWPKHFTWLSAQRPAPFAWQAQDLHPSGAVGNATLAAAEKGERLLDHGAQRILRVAGRRRQVRSWMRSQRAPRADQRPPVTDRIYRRPGHPSKFFLDAIEPDRKRPRPMDKRTTKAASPRMEFHNVDQDQDCRPRPRHPRRTISIAHQPGRSQGISAWAGASALASWAQPSSAARSPPATMATYYEAAIAAAAGFASSTPTATTSAAFASALLRSAPAELFA